MYKSVKSGKSGKPAGQMPPTPAAPVRQRYHMALPKKGR